MKAISGLPIGVLAILLCSVHSCLGANIASNSLSGNDNSLSGSDNTASGNDNTNNNTTMNEPYYFNSPSHMIPVNDKVIMSISIGSKPIGDIVLGMFTSIAPWTVKNFASICVGNTTTSDGVVLTYVGDIFHRVINNFMIQGGDFTNDDGRGALGIFGYDWTDENFRVQHCGAGFIGMANAGPNTNGAQFYIACVKTPWLDFKHTLFGVVLDGMKVVRAIEKNRTGPGDRPILRVLITGCRVIPLNETSYVPCAPVNG